MRAQDLMSGVKLLTAEGQERIYCRPYDKITACVKGWEGELLISADEGEFLLRDRIEQTADGFLVKSRCRVQRVSDAVAGIGLHCGVSLAEAYEELQFFMPSAWYGKRSLFEGKSNKYPMADGIAGGGIDGIGAPVCAVYSAEHGAAYSLEARDPAYTAPLPKESDCVVDGRITLPGIGFSNRDGCMLFYQFPATSYHIAGSSRTIGYYLPAESGMTFGGRFEVRSFACDSYVRCMKTVWRNAYERYAVVNDNIDCPSARRALIDYVASSYGVVNGIPQYMTNVDHFTHESGFLYRNADLALLLLEYGTENGEREMADRALAVLEQQAEKGYAGGNQVFPFERSRAEGVHCILKAYRFLKERGDERSGWQEFVMREARHFSETDEYYSIPLLCDLGMTSEAEAKGERIWVKFSDMGFYGGIVDFLADPVLDRESGYVGLNAFLALYDNTKDEKWLSRAAFCADYLETYQALRENGYAPPDLDGNEHFNMAAVGNEALKCNGLSYISANCNGTDVFNVLAVPLYYRLSLLTGDRHYLDYAVLLERNALEYIDLNNKAGALCDVMYGTGAGFMNEYFQLAVSDDGAGPYTGTAHDANIAWVPYVLLSAQRDVSALTGKPFLSECRKTEMRQNFAGECAFSADERTKLDLTEGDFYFRTRFETGAELEISLSRSADRIVFAHAEKFVVYRYTVTFMKGSEVLGAAQCGQCARFTSYAVPPSCNRIVISFHGGALLRQIQIFGESPTGNIFIRPKREKQSGVYRNGSDYSVIRENLGCWEYFAYEAGEYLPLIYDDVKNAWRLCGDEHLCVKSGCLVHPGAFAAVAIAFRAPEDGVYSVYRTVSPAQYLERFGAEITCSILREGELLTEKTCRIERRMCEEMRAETELRVGERLFFHVSACKSNANCFVSDEIELKITRGKL